MSMEQLRNARRSRSRHASQIRAMPSCLFRAETRPPPSACDQITYMDWPTSLVEASRKRQSDLTLRVAEVIKVQADPVARGSTEAPALCAGPPLPPATRLLRDEDLIQLRNTSTKSTSVSRESATPWPGRSRQTRSPCVQNRLEPSTVFRRFRRSRRKQFQHATARGRATLNATDHRRERLRASVTTTPRRPTVDRGRGP